MIWSDIEAMCVSIKHADFANLEEVKCALDDARALLRRCQEALARSFVPERVVIEGAVIEAEWRNALAVGPDGVGPTELIGWLYGESD